MARSATTSALKGVCARSKQPSQSSWTSLSDMGGAMMPLGLCSEQLTTNYCQGEQSKRPSKHQRKRWICLPETLAPIHWGLGVRQRFGRPMGKAPLWRDGAGGPQTLSKLISGTQGRRPEISPRKWRRSILPRLRSVARFAPGLYLRGERACEGKQRPKPPKRWEAFHACARKKGHLCCLVRAGNLCV